MMLRAGSALTGYAIEATDGHIGTVSDFLFDDKTWTVRWIVVHTGTWLTGRRVLVHPSAVGRPDALLRKLPVALSKERVKNSPDVLQDEPVSRQMEYSLYDYYGQDPMWGGSAFERGTMTASLSSAPRVGDTVGEAEERTRADADSRAESRAGDRMDDGDPHLRSMHAVSGYHVHALDGEIGHVEDLLFDDERWSIGYLVVDTRNWWPGEHVLLSPLAVEHIDWTDQTFNVVVERSQVRASPPWDPSAVIDDGYEMRLRRHYDKTGRSKSLP